MDLFHFVWVEIRNDPETAKATMEGLAFPRHVLEGSRRGRSRPAKMSERPGEPRNEEAGTRVLRRRKGRRGNGVKNPSRERGCLRIIP